MTERNKKESAAYRAANAAKFKDLGNGKWGGYRPGVINGPSPSTKRGKARTKCRWTD